MNVYKRILSYVLSLLLLLSLAACAPQGEDYGDFVPPEETDTLVVYGGSVVPNSINNAITLFKREYPNVEVEYRRNDNWMEDVFNTSLQSELAAGEGPDVILDYESVLFTELQTYKAMENGVYADLAPFFAWDKSIDLANYNEAAMDACMYMGHRYMVPLSFHTMTWVTTQEILDETGLEIQSGRQDFTKVMDMLSAYKQENPEQIIVSNDSGSGQFLWLLCPWSGAEAVNVEEKQITINTAQFRALIDVYKDLFYENDWANPVYAPQYGVGLMNHEMLFQWVDELSNMADIYSVLKSTQTPVLVNCPSFDGQLIGEPDILAFIREGSPNQLNAWRFLKILLSEEFQADTRNSAISLPVLRSAAKSKLTDLFENRYKPGTMSTEYGTLTRADVTEKEIDAILDTIYEVDDCRFAPCIGSVCDYLLLPYIEDGSNYESCLQTLEERLTLMLNE